jgi:sterol desaturase/sphingolipid hydroxylase (fatty acid hydroxylase superfamily)
LGNYLAHWLEHHTFLWRFHRKHHSAEILTPLTGGREHPVDALVSVSLIGLCVGVANGALGWTIGPAASPYLLFHTNCALVVYFFTLQHLRHSQVWLPFTGPLGWVLQSPAHHQLHHSANPEHYNRNLGFSLAIFDAVFGTLRVPRSDETIRAFGVAGEPTAEALADFYFQPFEFARSTGAPTRSS